MSAPKKPLLLEGDDLEALDRVGPCEGEPASPVTRHCPLLADAPLAERVSAPGLASTRIMPLPPGVKASLEVEDEVSSPVALSKTVTVIGRLPEVADFALPFSEEVSREHAAIVYFAGEFFLEDLASGNGTFLGGKRVAKVKLRDGDRFRVGAQTLVFRAKG